jgi:hypothetical protein
MRIDSLARARTNKGTYRHGFPSVYASLEPTMQITELAHEFSKFRKARRTALTPCAARTTGRDRWFTGAEEYVRRLCRAVGPRTIACRLPGQSTQRAVPLSSRRCARAVGHTRTRRAGAGGTAMADSAAFSAWRSAPLRCRATTEPSTSGAAQAVVPQYLSRAGSALADTLIGHIRHQ